MGTQSGAGEPLLIGFLCKAHHRNRNETGFPTVFLYSAGDGVSGSGTPERVSQGCWPATVSTMGPCTHPPQGASTSGQLANRPWGVGRCCGGAGWLHALRWPAFYELSDTGALSCALVPAFGAGPAEVTLAVLAQEKGSQDALFHRHSHAPCCAGNCAAGARE